MSNINRMYINNFSYLIADKEVEDAGMQVDFKNIDFKSKLPASVWRRYSRISKMAVFLSEQLWDFEDTNGPDSIHIGSGLAMIEDTYKFLSQMLHYEPSQLSPTPFIQSTHNTVSGQLALAYQVYGHNFTFSQGLQSYEDAYCDAVLQSNVGNTSHCLVGGIEEVNSLAIQIIQEQYPTLKTKKIAEGGAFFYLSNEVSASNQFQIHQHLNLNADRLPSIIIEYLKGRSFEKVMSNSLTLLKYINAQELYIEKVALDFSYANVPILKAKMLSIFSESTASDLLILYNFSHYWSFWHISKCK